MRPWGGDGTFEDDAQLNISRPTVDVSKFSKIRAWRRNKGSSDTTKTYFDIPVYQFKEDDGNATGDTQVCSFDGGCDLVAWQVGVVSIPAGSHVDGIFEAKNTSNMTTHTEVCHIGSTGVTNLSCASNVPAGFENFRFSLNMTSGSTPEIDNVTVFYESASGADTDDWVNESGDVMTGDLTMSGNSIFEIGKLVLEGVIDMAGNRITNLATPQTSSDAATKGYVDAQSPHNRNSQTVFQLDGVTISDLDTAFVPTAAGPLNVTIASSEEVEGRVIRIKDQDGEACDNPITIKTEGDAKIQGQDTIKLTSNFESVELEWNPEKVPAEWRIMNHYDPAGLC